MKQALKKPAVNLLIGGVVGALIMGAIWYAIYMIRDHGGVIAQVGTTPISRTEFLSQTESAAGLQTLQQLISNQLIEDGAKQYNITATSQEINTALQSLEQQNGITSTAQLQAVLAANNLTMADVQKSMKIQVLEQKLAERNVTVSNQEIQSYYDQNKSQMAQSGKVPPLSAVKSQVIAAIKQSKAVSSSQLLANLAKQYPILIMDSKYNSVKTTIETPQTQTPPTGATPPGAGSPGTGSTGATPPGTGSTGPSSTGSGSAGSAPSTAGGSTSNSATKGSKP